VLNINMAVTLSHTCMTPTATVNMHITKMLVHNQKGIK